MFHWLSILIAKIRPRPQPEPGPERAKQSTITQCSPNSMNYDEDLTGKKFLELKENEHKGIKDPMYENMKARFEKRKKPTPR